MKTKKQGEVDSNEVKGFYEKQFAKIAKEAIDAVRVEEKELREPPLALKTGTNGLAGIIGHNQAIKEAHQKEEEYFNHEK